MTKTSRASGNTPDFGGLLAGMFSNSFRNGFSVLDTETTGIDRDARICTAAFIALGYSSCLPEMNRLLVTADPQVPVPEAASRVNGFIRDPERPVGHYDGKTNLFGLPPFADSIPLVSFVMSERVPVCHNAHFDIWYLFSEYRRNMAEIARTAMTPEVQASLFSARVPFVICTKLTFASMLGLPVTPEYRRETSLDNLCGHLAVDLSARAAGHRAMADAELTAECFRRLASTFPSHIQVLRTEDILRHGLAEG